MQGWIRALRGWGCARNASLPMAGYEWAHDMIRDVLRPPEVPGEGSTDGMQREMILDGWRATEELRASRAQFGQQEEREFSALITRSQYYSRYGKPAQVVMRLPGNYLDMIELAVKPGLQNQIVTHSYALERVCRTRQARNENNTELITRLAALREPGSTALMCTVPSAPLFMVDGDAFSFAMRARFGMPALVGEQPSMPAAEAARGMQRAVNCRHNAAARAIRDTCVLGDRATSYEPNRKYHSQQGPAYVVRPDLAALGLDGAHGVADVTVGHSGEHAGAAAGR